jgi:hypothetical protein
VTTSPVKVAAHAIRAIASASWGETSITVRPVVNPDAISLRHRQVGLGAEVLAESAG